MALCAACRPSGGTPSIVPGDASPDRQEPAAIEDASTLADTNAPSTPPADVASDWCGYGLRGLDEETCYVLPVSADAGPLVLLVYLHGIVPPTKESPQKENVQRAVRNASARANAAAIVPRGARGIGPGAAHDWWAWPTEPGAHAKLAAAMVAKWGASKARLEAIVGAPFARTYLAGSSNGAYFLTTLALRGDLERFGFAIDGFAAISGGSAGGRAASSVTSPAHPFYVGYGTYDEETKISARALAQLLAAAKWPTLAAEHPFPHGVREAYLDEAFAFWEKER